MIELVLIIMVVGLVLVLLVLISRYRKRITGLREALNSASMELQHVQQAFHRFTPKKVVEKIISQGTVVHGERQEVTVLFADIIGFTSMAEQMEPEVLVEVLNGYFESMSKAISGHRGHVSKFIGDGIMALFGAPTTNRWHALDAVWAALAMRKALAAYNKTLLAKKQPPLTIGIGIHTGPVVAGVMGNKQLMEFTVIGDVVNTASRIESQTRKFDTDILISKAVRQHLDEKFKVRELPPLKVKGKDEPLVLYSVDGYTATSPS